MPFSASRVYATIGTTTNALAAIDTYLDGEVDQLYVNDNTLFALVTAAGSGTALIVASAGTPSTIVDGMIWSDIDAASTAAILKVYDSGTSSWIEVPSLTANQTFTNKTLISSILTSPVLNDTISGTAFKDEDSMVSDSATAVCSQQSIKAYVDATGENAQLVLSTQIFS